MRKIITGGLESGSREFQANFHIFTAHSTDSLELDFMMNFSCLSLSSIKHSIYTANYEFDKHYEDMTFQIYKKKFTIKKKKKKK